MATLDVHEPPPRSATLILGIAIGGVVLCPFLGPVAVYLADAERKRAVVEGREPEQLLMIGRVLGYVGTAVLCIDLIAVMIGAVLVAMSLGG